MALVIEGKKLSCRYCGSQRLVRNGKGGRNMKPMFLCRACGRASQKARGLSK